jgi:hypothetical protein
MFDELDSVVLQRANANVPLPVGSVGTIVYVYGAHPPVYEVEFTDRKGTTIGVHTVKEEDLAAEG